MSLQERISEANKNTDTQKIIKILKEKIIDEDSKKFLENGSFDCLRNKIIFLASKEISSKNLKEFHESENLIADQVFNEIFGLGLIDNYIKDKEITDIFIQDREMIIIKNGIKKYLGEVFHSKEEVEILIDKIKSMSSKTIDQRIPFLNTDLIDGSRCSIVIPPVSDRIYISIRVFNCINFNLEDLLNTHMFSKETYYLLIDFVKSKKNIIICGAMGSGKTTLLNTLAKLIPNNEFINIIQDTPEIKLSSHPFVRLLTTRPKSREIDNDINQDKLLYETLRMKADRIVIGEVRDSMAAYQMLQALNTGHRGSFSTIHADSAYDALLRLEVLTMEYRPNLTTAIIKKIISRAIDIVIYLESVFDKESNIQKRKIKELAFLENETDDRGEFKLRFL